MKIVKIPGDHIIKVHALVRERLNELGLSKELPSLGVTRVILEEASKFLHKLNEEQETPLTQDGEIDLERIPAGQCLETEDAIYITGHKMTVEHGRIVATHEDGSVCEAFGKCHCDHKTGLEIRELEGDFYATCPTCNVTTELQDTEIAAIGAWLRGEFIKAPY